MWQLGSATVREIYDELNRREQRAIAYTTVLTILQIMTEKGLVTRDTSRRSHVYRPAVSRADVETKMTTHLIEKLFQGSAFRLVLNAVQPTRLSKREREELKALLDTMDKERQ
jgi:BlaI family penicillinase repressor